VPIKITAFHVDLVRGFLEGEHERIAPMLKLISQNEVEGTSVLMYAAFVEAVHHRFTGSPRSDIIRFVADTRIRRGRNAPPINPGQAEKLIIAALGGDHPLGRAHPRRAAQREGHGRLPYRRPQAR
jgi:hypothetical protein